MDSESNEGMIYRRGPNGQEPDGQSINGVPGAYGTIGETEHVTMRGRGWHTSWDNPGPTDVHSTNHITRERTQH